MADLPKKTYTIKVMEHTTEIVAAGETHRADLKTNEIFTQQFNNVDVGALARFLNAEDEKNKKG